MKKHCVANVVPAIWQISLHENNCNCNSYKLSCKLIFIPFLPCLRNQDKNQESRFNQVNGLVTGSISVFCLRRLALYFEAIANSLTFIKEFYFNFYCSLCYSFMDLCIIGNWAYQWKISFNLEIIFSKKHRFNLF